MKDHQINPVKPFWSFNDKLEKEQLIRQITAMKETGIDGFFMHARGGLVTEYLSDEWFELIKACMEKADELGMEAWAYDENGWPSGFANGKVPKLGEDYQQKWLVISEYEDTLPQNTIAVYRKDSENYKRVSVPIKGDTVVAFDVNRYYTDVFNKEAIKCFMDHTHEKYYEKFGDSFGKSLKGFFTDEPQYGNGGNIPWSNCFCTEFNNRYSYDLKDRLMELFYDIGDYTAFRFDYYSMVADLFKDSFVKQMYDWCSEHNCKLTGHMMNEDNLVTQMFSTGGVMSCYEYFHEPGMDWLGRQIATPLVPKQLGSASQQLGRKNITETFALCGWDVSLNELKWMAQWQYVNGVTSLCPHLEGYSMRGCRKRDYPASLFTQLPWFETEYKQFATYFTKLGGLLDSVKEYAPVLVLHPITSAYTVYNPMNMDGMYSYSNEFENICENLSKHHIPYHFGDETLLQKYGSVKDKKIELGQCKYGVILLDHIKNITENTFKLLNDFVKNGGKVLLHNNTECLVNGRKNEKLYDLSKQFITINSYEEIKPFICEDHMIPGINSEDIRVSIRKGTDGSIIYYLVNLSDKEQDVQVEINGDYSLSDYDVINEIYNPVDCEYGNNKTKTKLYFASYASYVIFAKKGRTETPSKQIEEKIKLHHIFEIKDISKNCLTLDKCSYRINGGAWQPKTAVILIQQKLIELKEKCNFELKFDFCMEDGFMPNLELCAETPEKYKFRINGKDFKFCDNGQFVDHTIRKADISEFIVSGKNEIVMSGEFYQDSKVYHVLFDEGVHESEKNKLTFDTELESIYLLGDFSVKTNAEWHLGDKRCIFSGDCFYIGKPTTAVNCENITVDGFYFFSGSMELSQKINLNQETEKKYIILLNKLYCPSAQVFVNGKFAGHLNFAPYKLDVTDLIKDGENEIAIKLFSGNRNLLGPHHRPFGESYFVGPDTFTDKPGWTDIGQDPWTENYSFVLFGFEI